MKYNVYKNYNDLFIRCNKRLNSSIHNKVFEDSALFGSKKKIAFSGYYYQRKRNYKIIKAYKDNNLIPLIDYIFSYIYICFSPFLKTIKRLIFSKIVEIDSIDKYLYKEKNLTFSAGIGRLIPVYNSLNIQNVIVVKKKHFISFKDRLYILFLLLYYRVFDFSLLDPFLTLEAA